MGAGGPSFASIENDFVNSVSPCAPVLLPHSAQGMQSSWRLAVGKLCDYIWHAKGAGACRMRWGHACLQA